MGEKGNVEVIEQLKEMAQQQEPGLRDRVMQLLEDYNTVTGLSAPGGGKGDDEPDSNRPQA